MFQTDNSHEDTSCKPIVSGPHPSDLYLDSAALENTIALTRLGSLLEDESLDEQRMSRARDLVHRLRSDAGRPDLVVLGDDTFSPMNLAKQFWFEGAVRGNPLAQMALADEIMFEASETGDADARALATVLFGLAAQQGIEQAVYRCHQLRE